MILLGFYELKMRVGLINVSVRANPIYYLTYLCTTNDNSERHAEDIT